jgi:NAD(P)H-hydrate repair Nnr-like enzyme with NAD(P)H-hydrate dehydratase domain
MVGSAMAQGLAPWDAALQAVHEHGARADVWVEQHPGRTLTASDLLR